jgi:HEAT repeat protein
MRSRRAPLATWSIKGAIEDRGETIMRRASILLIVLALVGCGRAKTTSELAEQLKDIDVARRVQAVKLLSQRTGEAEVIVSALGQALKDENAFVRRDAALALGQFGPAAKPAKSALARLLKDRERSVRKAASEALKRIEANA